MQTPLLMIRDKQNELRVFHNVCSHRGMLLVHEESQLRTVIRCPYHSWSYDLDGELKATPHVGGMDKHDCDGFDRSAHGLKPVRSAVWMDVIFVNLSGTAEDFADYIGPLVKRWESFVGEGGFDLVRSAANGSHLDLSIRSNWKLPVENICEAYHVPWVHPGLNTYSPLDQHYSIIDEDNMSGQGTYRYAPSIVADERLPRFAQWPEDKLSHAEYLSDHSIHLCRDHRIIRRCLKHRHE
jgi:choline monooxygenase